MPFCRQWNNIIPTYNLKRNDSLMQKYSHFSLELEAISHWGKRVSSFASLKASLTVEAACILPLFILACVMMLYLIEGIRLQIHIGTAIVQTSKEFSQYGYITTDLFGHTSEDQEEWKDIIGEKFQIVVMKERVVELAGREYLNGSIIKNGTIGLDFSSSKILEERQELDLVVSYKLRLPFQIIRLPDLTVVQRGKSRVWTGYCGKEEENTEQNVDKVFVTSNGSVYHLELECSYLDLSIMSCPASEIESKRAMSNNTYKACERCHPEGQLQVYYTLYGTAFHKHKSCGGLVRYVREISINKINGEKPCERCGGGE